MNSLHPYIVSLCIICTVFCQKYGPLTHGTLCECLVN